MNNLKELTRNTEGQRKCSKGKSEPTCGSFTRQLDLDVSYCIHFYSVTLALCIRGLLYQRANLFKSSEESLYYFPP